MQGERKNSFNLYLKSLVLLLFLSVPFVLSFYFLVPVLINWYLKQDYSLSEQVVGILALAIPFIFVLAAQGAILLSSEKHLRLLIGISLFNLVLNIVGNLYLIPRTSL
jgi:O-antigen/teichoic acid export membrane protein